MDKKWPGEKSQNDNVVGSSEFGGANFGPKLKESDAKKAAPTARGNSLVSENRNNGTNPPKRGMSRLARIKRDGLKMQTIGSEKDDPDLEPTDEEKKKMGW